MYFKHSFSNHPSFCRRSVFVLAISWLVSIVSGILLAATFPVSLFSLMRTSLSGRVSIVGAFAVLIFPLFSSAVAIRFNRLRFIYLIATLKGICFGFSIFILLKLFGSAAWLVRWLILFSDACMSIPLFSFWIRHLRHPHNGLRNDFICCLVLCILIGVVDYYVISPFTVALLMKV